MKLFTQKQQKQLIAHGMMHDENKDVAPVVKWFTPDANATWLITEIDPDDPDIAFGLCDLGMGTPELGSVRMSEILDVRGSLGLTVERDLQFEAAFPISVYAKVARAKGYIESNSTLVEIVLDELSEAEEQALQQDIRLFLDKEVKRNLSDLIQEIQQATGNLFDYFPKLYYRVNQVGEMQEVTEHLEVTPWLAGQLRQHDEAVIMDFFGMSIWCRVTHGQDIHMDAVIRTIYHEQFG